MSKRKRRSQSAEVSISTQQPCTDTKDEHHLRRPSPPRRNVAMLSISIFALVVWIAFLMYVALFG